MVIDSSALIAILNRGREAYISSQLIRTVSKSLELRLT
jgi:uncharacterized protein with PIN domain